MLAPRMGARSAALFLAPSAPWGRRSLIFDADKDFDEATFERLDARRGEVGNDAATMASVADPEDTVLVLEPSAFKRLSERLIPMAKIIGQDPGGTKTRKALARRKLGGDFRTDIVQADEAVSGSIFFGKPEQTPDIFSENLQFNVGGVVFPHLLVETVDKVSDSLSMVVGHIFSVVAVVFVTRHTWKEPKVFPLEAVVVATGLLSPFGGAGIFPFATVVSRGLGGFWTRLFHFLVMRRSHRRECLVNPGSQIW